MNTVFLVLTAQIVLGALDNLWHHEILPNGCRVNAPPLATRSWCLLATRRAPVSSSPGFAG